MTLTYDVVLEVRRGAITYYKNLGSFPDRASAEAFMQTYGQDNNTSPALMQIKITRK